MVRELIPVLGSQPTGDVSHKPGGRLPLLSARPAVTRATLKQGCYQFCCLENRGTMGVNSLPKTVTRQRHDYDLNTGPSAPESSTLTTRLPSHTDRCLTLKPSPTTGHNGCKQFAPGRGANVLSGTPVQTALRRTDCQVPTLFAGPERFRHCL